MTPAINWTLLFNIYFNILDTVHVRQLDTFENNWEPIVFLQTQTEFIHL